MAFRERMTQISSTTTNKLSSENRDFDLVSKLRSDGYSASEIDSILHIARYVSAFTMNFDDGSEEFFDLRGARE